MKFTLNLLFFLTFPVFLLAQTSSPDSFCGTLPQKSKWLTEYQQNPDAFPVAENGFLYVPLTVHIVGRDDGSGYYSPNRVLAALCTLNEDFADSEIRFYLKGPFNYIANSNFYEHNFQGGAQMMAFHNELNSVNCYIVEDPAGNCGYYSWSGDAIALKKSCIGPTDHTWAHEIGHYLSLPHTFYGWEGVDDFDYNQNAPNNWGNSIVERANGSNCHFAADGFCDTPADYLNYRWSCDGSSMSTLTQHDPGGATFKSDGSFFMSYSLDHCAGKFSGEQINAMRANLQFQRSYLLSNQNPPVSIEGEIDGISPVNGAVVSPAAVILNWTPADHADYYLVEVSRLSSFPFVTHREIVTGNSVLLYDFTPEKEYYWRVRPFGKYDFSCDGQTSDVFAFSTNNELTATGSPSEIGWNVLVQPNPSVSGISSVLFVENSRAEEVQLTITDLNGRVLLRSSHSLNPGENRIALPTEGLQSGLYLIRLEKQERRSFLKWIVQ